MKKELFASIDEQLHKLKDVVDNDIPEFNKLVSEANVPAVILQKEDAKNN